MTIFINAFGDELEKLARKTYPFSQILQSRSVEGLKTIPAGAAAGSLAVGLPFTGGLLGFMAGRGIQTGRRAISARALLGQARRGGKGMMKHDKRMLAEALGVGENELEGALKRMGKDSAKAGKSTNPISRALRTKYNPLTLPDRMTSIRSTAGRMNEIRDIEDAIKKLPRSEFKELGINRRTAQRLARKDLMEGSLTGSERNMLKEIGDVVKRRRVEKGVAGGAAAALGLGAASAGGSEKSAAPSNPMATPRDAGTVDQGRLMVKGWTEDAERAKLKNQTQSALKGWENKGYFGQKAPSAPKTPKTPPSASQRQLRPRSAQEALRGSYGS